MGIRWDKQKNSYVDSESGSILSQSRVLSILNQAIESGHQNLLEIVDQLFNGDIDLEQFASLMASNLRTMHISQAIIAKNGLADLTTNNLKTLRQVLKDEFVTGVGVDENGNKHPFGIINLIKDIDNGDVSLAQLKNRVAMFGENSRKSGEATKFSDAEEDPDLSECLNILNKVKTNHHPICIEATARGWIPLKEMKDYGLPTRHPLCKCNLIYR